MNGSVKEAHWSFWAIGGVALVWNLLGIINFFVQMNPQALSAYRETEQAIVQGRPLWATAGFALAVFGGAMGAALLLMREKASFYLFVASFFGVLVAIIHLVVAGVNPGVGEAIGIILMPLAVAGFLVSYSVRAAKNEWLK